METPARTRRLSSLFMRAMLQILAPGFALVALLFGYLLLIGALSDPDVAAGSLQLAGYVFVVGALAGGVLYLSGLDRVHPILRILAPAVGMSALFVGTLLLFDAFSDPSLEILISWWLAPAPYAFAAAVLVGGLLFLGSRGRRGASRIVRVLGWAATVLGVPALILLYLLTLDYALTTSSMWW